MKIVNTEEFNALMNEDAVLVDFFATWCGPCKMLTPVLESVANKLDGKVKIVKVDVDESPDLAQRFGIMSVPTMILFKKGQKAAAFSGYMPEQMLMQNIESKLQDDSSSYFIQGKNMYYIAYGSNLNKEEMKSRCKDAKFVSLA